MNAQAVADILLPLGKHALTILLQVLGFIAGTSPVWGPIAWKVAAPLARALLLRANNAQTLAAFDALEAAVKPAVNVALESIKVDLHVARMPDSPGGTGVTPDEYRRAVAKACAAAWSTLDKGGIIKAVVTAYGGEDAVKRSLQVLVERTLSAKHGVDKPEESPASASGG